jgi:hypothetical protein
MKRLLKEFDNGFAFRSVNYSLRTRKLRRSNTNQAVRTENFRRVRQRTKRVEVFTNGVNITA